MNEKKFNCCEERVKKSENRMEINVTMTAENRVRMEAEFDISALGELKSLMETIGELNYV